MIHTVVLAEDFESVERRYLALVRALRQTAADLGWCEVAFRKINEGTDATPAYCRERDAEHARERVLAVLDEHVGEND